MMIRSRISLLLLTVLWACGGDSPTDTTDTEDPSGSTTANEFIAAGLTSLENAMFTALNIDDVSQLGDFSFAESNGLFLDALALSPSNDTASIGAAITAIFLLEDNSAVRAVIDDWDAWAEEEPFPSPAAKLLAPAVTAIGDPVTLPLSFSTETAEQVANIGMVAFELAGGLVSPHVPPPSLVETQTVLRDVVRPALITAMGHLLDITNTSFTFTVTEAMQGELVIDADPLELDYTEILVLQAGVQLVLAAVDVATAYTLSPNPLTPQGVVDAMTPGSTFLKLATGGAASLGNALVELQLGGSLLLDAINELLAETDDQTNDIIKIDPNCCDDLTFQSAQEVEDARALIQDVLDALSAPTVITIDEGGFDEFSFTLDAGEFFTDPIPDLKALLAPYEVFTADEAGETVVVFHWLDLNLDDWTFPDPTFSGILPAMTTTSDLINTFPGFAEEVFFDFSLAEGYYALITVDGRDCQLDVSTGGPGCDVGGDFYEYGDLSLDGFDGMSEVYFSLTGFDPMVGTVFLQSNGTYVVSDNGGGVYTVDMNFVSGDNTPFVAAGTLTDIPGFTSFDGFRSRGGSTLTFSALGSAFVFEKQ